MGTDVRRCNLMRRVLTHTNVSWVWSANSSKLAAWATRFKAARSKTRVLETSSWCWPWYWPSPTRTVGLVDSSP